MDLDNALSELTSANSDLLELITDPKANLDKVKASIEMPKFKAEARLKLKEILGTTR